MIQSGDAPLYVRATDRSPIYRLAPKVGRNSICPFENKKFKNCCGKDGSNHCKKLLSDYLDNLQDKSIKSQTDDKNS
jgi:hypothetical protein